MSIIRDGLQSSNLDVPIITPTLNLDFANSRKLDSRITFTRASTGTYIGPDGLIKTAAVNEPRFDYDPISGESKGLLIEEGRTNNILESDRLDTSWLITVSGGSGTFIDGEKVTSSILSVDAIYDASLSTSSTFILRNSLSGQPYGTLTGLTSGATRNIDSRTNIGGERNVSASLTTETTAPDGTNNAVLVTPTTADFQLRTISKRFTTSTAGNYTFSIFFKNKSINNNNIAIYIGNQTSLSNVVANFYLSTKTFNVVGQNGGWTGSVGYQDYSNGWGRIWVTATTTAGSHTFLDGNFWIGGYRGTYTSVGSLYAWGAQLEEGAFPTSYIPTTTSTATRSADTASMTGTNFSSWYNQTEGTLYASGKSSINYSVNPILGLAALNNSSSPTSYRIDIRYNQAGNSYVFAADNTSSVNYTLTRTSGLLLDRPKYALSYSSRNISFAVNSSLTRSNFSNFTPPSQIDRLLIGSIDQPTFYNLNGTISRLTYYPKALTDNQLQYLTN